MRPPQLTLAAAESLTSGHVQALIGAVSGASDYFRGGITAYTLEQKVRHLGVDRAAAVAVNCVSEDIARQMARGACALFGSDAAVATTGYAEPSAEQGIAAPFAFWALAHRGADHAWRERSGRIVCLGFDRIGVQTLVARSVVAELAAFLGELRG